MSVCQHSFVYCTIVFITVCALQERARNRSTIYTPPPASHTQRCRHDASIPYHQRPVGRGESQMSQIKQGQELLVLIAGQGQGQGQGMARIMRGCRQRCLTDFNDLRNVMILVTVVMIYLKVLAKHCQTAAVQVFATTLEVPGSFISCHSYSLHCCYTIVTCTPGLSLPNTCTTIPVRYINAIVDAMSVNQAQFTTLSHF